MQINYEEKNTYLSYSEWPKIVPIFLQPKPSNPVLSFMNEIHISDLCNKTKTESEFMKTMLLYFNMVTIYNSYSWYLEGINNLLKFFKPLIISLIKVLLIYIISQNTLYF